MTQIQLLEELRSADRTILLDGSAGTRSFIWQAIDPNASIS